MRIPLEPARNQPARRSEKARQAASCSRAAGSSGRAGVATTRSVIELSSPITSAVRPDDSIVWAFPIASAPAATPSENGCTRRSGKS